MCCILSSSSNKVKEEKKYCIKNAAIKLSPGYNCASSEYFMAPVVEWGAGAEVGS